MTALISCLAMASLGFQQPQAVALASVNNPAPKFTVAGADGEVYSLDKFKGKYVVLEWTNKDCPVVRRHYDSGNMQVTQKKAVEMGAVWLAVCSSAPGKQGNMNASDHVAHAKSVRSNAKTVLLDSDGKIGKMYSAKTTPQIAVIGPDGTLIYNGAIDDNPGASLAETRNSKNYALAALEQAMAGKPVAVQTSQPYGCGIKY